MKRLPAPNNTLRALLLCTALLLPAACAKQESPMVGIDSMQGMKKETAQREKNLAADSSLAGNTMESLRLYHDIYKKDPDNKGHALRYAQLLRKTGKPEGALKILAPFGLSHGEPKDGADPEVLLEIAACDIALARFDDGEPVLNAILENEKAKDLHTEAYNLMGVVLDARGKHREAEQMFKMALDGWKGNPATVMNNLALSLANQGMFDQSLTTLRRALVISPDKQEVARNIQIVQDLRDNLVPEAPLRLAPAKKVIRPKTQKSAPACAPCPTPG